MKNISHYDRIHDVNAIAVYPPVKLKKRAKLSVTDSFDEKCQRVVKKVEYKVYDNAEQINKYRVQDFALENLISVGTPLTPTHLSESNFAVLDNLDSKLDINNNNNNNLNS